MKNNLGGKVYDGVKKDIITGVYRPNTFLSEGEIADKYQVSKAPVRTALHRLCEEGYLVSYARKGYLVMNISESDYSKIQQLRYAVEALAVSYLVLYASKEDLEMLRSIAKLKTPTDDKYATVNSQFHMAMARLTDNRFLIEVLDNLLTDVEHIYFYINTKNQPVEEQDCHGQLLDAIEKKDQKAALKWLKEDMDDSLFANRYKIIPFAE